MSSTLTPRQAAIQSIASTTYQLQRVNFRETHIKDLFGCLVFNEAIQREPNHFQSLRNRCYTRAVLGQVRQALTDCNEALRLKPGDTFVLAFRGFTHLKLGQFDNAIADYDVSLKAEPRRAYWLYGRGVARIKKGDAASGKDDIAAARAIFDDVASEFVKLGVPAP